MAAIDFWCIPICEHTARLQAMGMIMLKHLIQDNLAATHYVALKAVSW